MITSGPTCSAHLSIQATASPLTKLYLSASVASIPGKIFFWNCFAAGPKASTKIPIS